MKLSAREIAFRVNHKLLSAEQYTAEVLSEIKSRDKHYQAFLSFESNAITKAKKLDESLKSPQNDYLPLAGVPIAVKDNIAVKDMPLTCGSKILENYISPYSATAINLLEKMGAIIIGKTNMDEFAMGSTGEYSAYYRTLNPSLTDCVPGGSSGGSAAAVAAGFVPVALGSDSGGSVRQPASFCQISALKPTRGTISRKGLVPLANSLDCIGIMGNDLQDIELVFKSISSYDKSDNTSTSLDQVRYKCYDSYLIPKDLSKILSPKMNDSWNRFISTLSRKCELRQIDLPVLSNLLATYMIINMAESISNLSRFDGIRYGKSHRSSVFGESIMKSRSALLGNEVKRRLIIGNFILSENHYSKYYEKALDYKKYCTLKISELISDSALIMPVSPFYPFKYNQIDSQKMYKADILTVLSSLCGFPAISIPAIKAKTNYRAGLQIIGKKFSDISILNIGQRILRMNY